MRNQWEVRKDVERTLCNDAGRRWGGGIGGDVVGGGGEWWWRWWEKEGLWGLVLVGMGGEAGERKG